MALTDRMEREGNYLFRYRSYIPLIALGAGVITFIITRSNPNTLTFSGEYYGGAWDFICLIVCAAGFLVRLYTVGYTPKNTSGRNTKDGQIADSLNTTGIYSVCRHPLYLANFLMYLGPAMLSANLWFIVSFCLAFWLYYERIMIAEEEFLKKKFGVAYTAWCGKTPAFIPSFKNYKKPALDFSYKKIIAKEKNGFAAMFLLFAAFNVLGAFISGRNEYNKALIFIAVLALMLFTIATYVKRKTRFFEEEGR